MDLNIVATDSNVDNEDGPRVTKNIEPIRLRRSFPEVDVAR